MLEATRGVGKSVRPVSVRMEKAILMGKDGGRQTGSGDKRQAGRIWMTHASTLSSATIGSGTASILALPLCESANTTADVVAEESFVPGVGHDCSRFAYVFWTRNMRFEVDGECQVFCSV